MVCTPVSTRLPSRPLAHFVAASLPALFTDAAIFSQAVLALRQQIDTLFQASQKATGLRSVLTWHRAVLHGITLLKQLMKARQRYLQPQRHLQFLAAHALDLLRYDFRSSGITRDAYSFRENISKSDLNSPASPPDSVPSSTGFPHLFLTPHQCQILAPSLLPVDYELPSIAKQLVPEGHPEGANPHVSPSLGMGWETGSPLSKCVLHLERGRGRGRPPSSPLPLLDALFWKLAHHARWQDLPAGAPPMLTCRRYYTRLYRSGRLLTLYTALHQDLLTRGQTDLLTLVNQGCFTISGSQITFQPELEQDATWQLRTALLFLQQAHHISRRILREDARLHPRGLPHFRL